MQQNQTCQLTYTINTIDNFELGRDNSNNHRVTVTLILDVGAPESSSSGNDTHNYTTDWSMWEDQNMHHHPGNGTHNNKLHYHNITLKAGESEQVFFHKRKDSK